MAVELEQEQHILQKLPDECWSKIFSHLDDNFDWESLSLTCKKFLLLTNSSRICLSFSRKQKVYALRRLLKRYPNLRKLRVSSLADLDANIDHVIAQSNLNLEELDLSFYGCLQTVCLEDMGFKLKALKLFCAVSNADLIRIADRFPLLEEIRIQETLPDEVVVAAPVNDEGIHYLSYKLKRLRTVDISHEYISDKSLISLASNCAHLECFNLHISPSLGASLRVTDNGISFLIKNCQHLKSLVITGILKMGCFGAKSSTLHKNLQTLRLEWLDISDEFLYSIIEARISLTHLHLILCKGYSFTGIWKLLNSYRSLKTLVLCGVEFLTNEHVDKLSPFLHNLTSIQLFNCPLLTDSAFVMLTQRCPFLCEIGLNQTGLGKEEHEYDELNLKNNFVVKVLRLTYNNSLSTSTLCRLLRICPKVEKLCLSSSKFDVQQWDVVDVLECSRELLDLDVSHCQLKFTREDMEFSMIENMNASSSDINDEGLITLSKICPRLLHLRLMTCENVTEAGVKEVVKSCKQLRSLCIFGCMNVDEGIIDWVKSNYPSVTRRIYI